MTTAYKFTQLQVDPRCAHDHGRSDPLGMSHDPHVLHGALHVDESEVLREGVAPRGGEALHGDEEAPHGGKVLRDVEAPRDVVEAPRDVVEAPRDVVEAPRDVVEAPRGVAVHGDEAPQACWLPRSLGASHLAQSISQNASLSRTPHRNFLLWRTTA